MFSYTQGTIAKDNLPLHPVGLFWVWDPFPCSKYPYIQGTLFVREVTSQVFPSTPHHFLIATSYHSLVMGFSALPSFLEEKANRKFDVPLYSTSHSAQSEIESISTLPENRVSSSLGDFLLWCAQNKCLSDNGGFPQTWSSPAIAGHRSPEGPMPFDPECVTGSWWHSERPELPT